MEHGLNNNARSLAEASLKVVLYDTGSANNAKIEVLVDIHDPDQNGFHRGIDIGAKGYGSYTMEDGSGFPVYIEFYEGKLMLRVWADINSEEPTHTISLEGARESLRKEPFHPDNFV